MIIRSVGRLWWAFAFREWRKKINDSVHHLAGPKGVRLGPGELLSVTLVKDGAFHLETFLDHHRDLGVKQFVLLDNGSSDATVEIASGQDDVTLLQSSLSFKTAQFALRGWLMERFGIRCWTLMVDIDERFDYPFRGSLGLATFLDYLDRNSFSAVPAHMLDLFAEGPSDTWPASGEDMVERCIWYDISSMKRETPRILFNRHRGPTVQTMSGGIRQKIFGLCPNLTKYPLIHWGRGARPYLTNTHFIRCGHIADITCLLKHYKFTSGFANQVKSAVREGQYFNNSSEYRAYGKTLGEIPGLNLKTPDARRYQGFEELLKAGFLNVSENYLRLVEGEKQNNPQY